MHLLNGVCLHGARQLFPRSLVSPLFILPLHPRCSFVSTSSNSAHLYVWRNHAAHPSCTRICSVATHRPDHHASTRTGCFFTCHSSATLPRAARHHARLSVLWRWPSVVRLRCTVIKCARSSSRYVQRNRRGNINHCCQCQTAARTRQCR